MRGPASDSNLTASARARFYIPRVITLRPVSAYASELKRELPRGAFEPARSRLLWLPVHLGVIGAGTAAIGERWAAGWLWPFISVAIGCAFAGLAFVAHETLHGAIVRSRLARHLVGWLAFVPFALSPRLWIAWHNRMHHGHANRPGVDPDAYPTLGEHQKSLLVRVSTDCFGIGRGRLRGLTSLVIGFHVQCAHMLLAARRRGLLAPRALGWAVAETALGVTLWLGVLAAFGFEAFVFVYVLPALVANACVMGYIFTNHALSPHTEINDPLANSLSVTVPRWLDFLTLRFGFHVEHHLFPWMSSRHAPLVRELVRARWPERYQSMPLSRAFLTVFVTPRVYADAQTLVDPKTGSRVRTLAANVRDRFRQGVRSQRARVRRPATS